MSSGFYQTEDGSSPVTSSLARSRSTIPHSALVYLSPPQLRGSLKKNKNVSAHTAEENIKTAERSIRFDNRIGDANGERIKVNDDDRESTTTGNGDGYGR